MTETTKMIKAIANDSKVRIDKIVENYEELEKVCQDLSDKFDYQVKQVMKLEKENAELKRQYAKECEDVAYVVTNYTKQLTKAKEIIKMLHSDCYSIAECEDTNLGLWEDDLAKAEQFLSEVEK